MKRYLQALILVLVFTLGLTPVYGLDSQATSQGYANAGILAHILKQQLEINHFSQKRIDDAYSRAAFDSYLKQLDPQKMFLLKGDVQSLKTYSELIDDEMRSGKLELPKAGAELLMKRVTEILPVVRELLSKDFDFSEAEFLETDPEKRDYCATEEELRARWRKVLKLQVLNRYLTLLDEGTSAENPAPDLHQKKKTPDDARTEAREKVLKSYETTLSRMLKEKESEPFDRYFQAVTKVFDPHTEYLPPVSKEDFDIHMKGSLEGIGATLREDEGYIKVESIIPGGPASLQGQLQADDRILKVAEGNSEPVDIVGMRVRDAVRLIRGKKGTEVKLTVLKPNGVELAIQITRDVIQIEETFAKGTILKPKKGDRAFGYLLIPSFYRDFDHARDGGKSRNATDDVRNEIRKLQSEDIRGLIIDLRSNGGGALVDAVNIAGLFIKTGPVVQIKNIKGGITVLSDDDPGIEYAGPIVVLVNRFSASASEILAGALQDYGRAVIIGDHTYGKGTVQTVIDLNDSFDFYHREQRAQLGALKLTTQKFYRVSGESTQHRGVIPDIALPDVLEGLKNGERYLDFALPWDTVNPAHYEKWERLPDLADLKSRSTQRVQAEQSFLDIAAEGRKYREQQNNTVRSLQIDDARKEHEEAKKLRDKTSKKGKSHGDPDKKKEDMRKLTAEEKKKRWVKEVNEDPYVQEALAALIDITSPKPLSGTASAPRVVD